MPYKNGPWTVKSRRIAYETPWIKVQEDSVIAPSGADSEYSTIKLKDWVLILPVDKEGNVYLVKQFRYALKGESIDTPCGCVDAGESPLVAAKRELSEELGIVAKSWTALGKTKISPSQIENIVYFFLAEDISFGKANMDENEDITSLKVSLEKALEMVENGEIIDATSGFLILKAKMYLDKRK
jgi:8-oxo-dGTP pyrophosphatase MutT (NUDIX family)